MKKLFKKINKLCQMGYSVSEAFNIVSQDVDLGRSAFLMGTKLGVKIESFSTKVDGIELTVFI